MKTATWYFDFVSPFAYLQSESLQRLPDSLEVRYRPVLFAGLLDHWGSKGPAEIPSKRRFTYRYVVWLAKRHGIGLTMPPGHPFNPLKALRLAISLDSKAATHALFRFIWREGRSLDDPGLGNRLGIDSHEIARRASDPAVKLKLRQNTDTAIQQGVFGVPTFIIDDELLWGFDATDMLVDYCADPRLFEDPEMRRISDLPQSAQRVV